MIGKTTGCVLDVANQRGGAMPSVVTLHDWSRYQSHGAITTCTWTQIPSTGLWILDFNSGTPDYVEIAEADSRQMNFTSGDFSGIARVKFDSVVGNRAMFFRGLWNTDGYFWLNINGRMYLYTCQAVAQQESITDAGLLVAHIWYTLGFSRSGNSVRLYVNGVDMTTTVGNHIDPLTCIRSAKIGVYDDLVSWPFDGQMSLLQVYDYALSPAQHRAMYHKTRWLFGDTT